MTDETVQCTQCGEDYPLQRRLLGFLTCTTCGEHDSREVKHCIVPMHKSGLVVISPGDKDLLVGISNKGGIVTGAGGGGGGGDIDGTTKDNQARQGEPKETPAVRKSPDNGFVPRRRRYTPKQSGELFPSDDGQQRRRAGWHKRSEPRRRK